MRLRVAFVGGGEVRHRADVDAGVMVLADATPSRYPRGGDIAAQIVADLVAAGAQGDATGPARLATGARRAQAALACLAAHEPYYAELAAVVAAFLLDGAGLHIGHAGDVRAYRVRDGAVSWLTEDHLEAGAVTRVISPAAGGLAIRTIDAALGDLLVLVPRDRHTSHGAIAGATGPHLVQIATQIAGGQSAFVARIEP